VSKLWISFPRSRSVFNSHRRTPVFLLGAQRPEPGVLNLLSGLARIVLPSPGEISGSRRGRSIRDRTHAPLRTIAAAPSSTDSRLRSRGAPCAVFVTGIVTESAPSGGRPLKIVRRLRTDPGARGEGPQDRSIFFRMSKFPRSGILSGSAALLLHRWGFHVGVSPEYCRFSGGTRNRRQIYFRGPG
jgi:hypothetical protein